MRKEDKIDEYLSAIIKAKGKKCYAAESPQRKEMQSIITAESGKRIKIHKMFLAKNARGAKAERN